MKHLIKRALIACALLAAPAAAMAATAGFATTNVNLRSGPSTAYPAVVVVQPGARLTVYGCLADTPWCDVSIGRIRGWMAGRYIRTVYRERRVYVAPEYYRPLGIPIIRFDLDNYWGRYYRGRDFYGERDRWRREYRPRGYDDDGYESDRERLIRRRAERSWNDDNNDNGWRNDNDGYRRDDRQRPPRRWNNDDGDWSGGVAPDNNGRDRRPRQPEPAPPQQIEPPPQPQPEAPQPPRVINRGDLSPDHRRPQDCELGLANGCL